MAVEEARQHLGAAAGTGARRPGRAASRWRGGQSRFPSGVEDAERRRGSSAAAASLPAGPFGIVAHGALSRNRRRRDGLPGGGLRRRAAACSGAATAGPANIWSDPDGALASILAAAGAAAARGRRSSSRELTPCSASPAPTWPEAAAGLAGRLPFARVADRDRRPGGAEGGARRRRTGSPRRSAPGRSSACSAAAWCASSAAGGSCSATRAAARGSAARSTRRRSSPTTGSSETTPLLAAALAAHGGPAGIVAFGQRAAPADFAREVPRVLAAAAAGDPAGPAILARGGGGDRARRSTGCRPTGRCRSASSAGSGRSSPSGSPARYPG